MRAGVAKHSNSRAGERRIFIRAIDAQPLLAKLSIEAGTLSLFPSKRSAAHVEGSIAELKGTALPVYLEPGQEMDIPIEIGLPMDAEEGERWCPGRKLSFVKLHGDVIVFHASASVGRDENLCWPHIPIRQATRAYDGLLAALHW